MRHNRPLRIFMFATMALVAVPLFGFLVMSLWNWLMPSLFGIHAITFWQAFGLLILSRILFGGFHGRACGPRQTRKRLMEGAWERMTPEERERFRGRMRDGCGFGEKGSESA